MSSKSLPQCGAVLVLVLAAVAAPAQGPPSSSPEARERMKALEFMVGDWQGEAWSQMRPDVRERVTQRELVEWVAGGEALLVRGQGSKDGKVVKNKSTKVKFSTVVKTDELEAFYTRYAEVCKAGMTGLKKRDRKKAKGKKATKA